MSNPNQKGQQYRAPFLKVGSDVTKDKKHERLEKLKMLSETFNMRNVKKVVKKEGISKYRDVLKVTLDEKKEEDSKVESMKHLNIIGQK